MASFRNGLALCSVKVAMNGPTCSTWRAEVAFTRM